ATRTRHSPAATAAAAAAATSFVDRRRPATCCTFPIVAPSATTAYTATGLSASTSYSYRVQASGPGGLSPYSNTASATTLPPPPTAPPSLTATPASSSQINLAWTAASGAVTTYLVRSEERRVGNDHQAGRSTAPP